jgi:hypothetical protein
MKKATNRFPDLTIYIPTLGRAEIQNTFKNLSPELQAITILVIHTSEEDNEYYEDYNHIVCPLFPISEKRAWIINQCKTKYLIMLDDDLLFYTRKDDIDWRLRYNDKGEDMNNMFEDILSALQAGYAHVGISPRAGNNRVMEVAVENSRMYAVLGFNVQIIKDNVKFCRIQFQEDFDITLQLLRKGYPNCVYYKWAHGPMIGYQTKGGCENERTLELQNASVRKLVELHPGFVTVRKMNKKYKGEMATRDEVIVYWKKAFASSDLENVKKKKASASK